MKNGKAPGPDGLKKEDLSVDIDVIAESLSTIFQYSIQTGRVPGVWRHANVVPIFKGGDKKQAGNYRPVSLTSICCKMLEHIVVSHILSVLGDQLHRNQHGFRKGLSCTTQLATVHDIWSMVDEGCTVQAVILDFSKAFDKVLHGRLLAKLVDIGLDHCSIRGIKAFLSG